MVIRISGNKIRNKDVKKIEEISDDNVFLCYQCGKCSSGCPSGALMDILPNRVMHLLQIGEVERVLNSKSIWICAACMTCSVRCPKGIDIAAIMEAARQMVLRKNINYTKLPLEDKEDIKILPTIALVANFRKLTG